MKPINAWNLSMVAFALLLTCGVWSAAHRTRADDGWSERRRDRWHATYNAVLSGCMANQHTMFGILPTYGGCMRVAANIADQSHGELPR